MTIVVEKIDSGNKKQWEQYIESREDTSYVDYFNWRDAIEKTYGLKHYWYVAKVDSVIQGVLALTLTKHPIFGSYLASAPFGSSGGFYAENDSISKALLAKAEEIKNKLKAQYVLIRHLDEDKNVPPGWRQSPIYRSFRVRTDIDSDTMLYNVISRKARNQIKKSQKSGYLLKYGSYELFDHAWYVISRGMKYLGSPYHSKKFLNNILDLFTEQAKFAVVYDQHKKPLASFLCIRHNNILSPVHGGFVRKEGDTYVGVFLYWSIIEMCCSQDIKWVDFGRSLIDSPQEHFKKKFQPVQKDLAYWYNMPDGRSIPSINQNNPKYKLPRLVWSRLPLLFHEKIGPHLIKGVL